MCVKINRSHIEKELPHTLAVGLPPQKANHERVWKWTTWGEGGDR